MKDNIVLGKDSRALLLSNLTGSRKLAEVLADIGVELYSYGEMLERLNKELGSGTVLDVVKETGFEDTGDEYDLINPRIFGGILLDHENPVHAEYMEKNNIKQFDIVDIELEIPKRKPKFGDFLYGLKTERLSLARAAAKNFLRVISTLNLSEVEYHYLAERIKEGGICLKDRFMFSEQAFTSSYKYLQFISNVVYGYTSKHIADHYNEEFRLGDFDKMMALISVYDKSGIKELAEKLNGYGINIYSSGGTAEEIKKAGIDVTEISELTRFPESPEGLVKTLHPEIHRRLSSQEKSKDRFYLLVINFYPFGEEIKKEGCTIEDARRKIDIGGPSMILSAMRGFPWVIISTHPDSYEEIKIRLDRDPAVNAVEAYGFIKQCGIPPLLFYEYAIKNYFEKLEPEYVKNFYLKRFEKGF